MILPLTIQLPLGLLLAVIVAYGAYRAQALDLGGALAAGILGTVIFGLGGLAWALVLLAFFISSSTLSRLFGGRKAAAEEKAAKGSRRDTWQVLANGGIAGLCALLIRLVPARNGPETAIWLVFCASLAAANADTWATELGVLSHGQPVMITNGKKVEPGTSGAVSPTGTVAALAGSALIALLGGLLEGWALHSPSIVTSHWRLYGLVLLAGLAGSLIDSLLGATLQVIYFCPNCQKETERHPRHVCGTETTLIRGWPWLNNDWVNGACTFSSAVLALAVGLADFQPAVSPPSIILTGTTSPPASGVINNVQLIQGATINPALKTGVLGLFSPAFTNEAPIPIKYTCSGSNGSPELDWAYRPLNTKSVVLILEDPDAPMGIFHHWLLYNIPPGLAQLAAGQPVGDAIPGVGTQGKNDAGHTGYDGPCPPKGNPHRYYFRLYATTVPLGSLPPGLNTADLMKAIQDKIIAQDQWMGIFQR